MSNRRKSNPLPTETPLEAALKAILGGTVRLDDAACIGQAALFDPAGDGEPRTAVDERHREAVRLCWECPAIGPCRDWALTEPESDTVLAGRLPRPHRPPGRPTTDAA